MFPFDYEYVATDALSLVLLVIIVLLGLLIEKLIAYRTKKDIRKEHE